MWASDLFKKFYREKPVREWEKQERGGEETKQACDLGQTVVRLDLTGELWV